MSRSLFSRLFPVPKTLSMHGGGLEISEGTVKYFRFNWSGGQREVGAFGIMPLPEGTVVGGEIRQPAALIEILKKVRAQCGFYLAHASLPEQKGYLFDLTLPRQSETSLGERVVLALPEHVPLSPAESVVDCEGIPAESTSNNRSLAVTVFPEEVARAYADALVTAGFSPVSFELEPQAAARAVLWGEEQQGALLLCDYGAGKTVLSVVQNGVVRFTTSQEGSAASDNELAKALGTPEQVYEKKQTEGLMPGSSVASVLEPAVLALEKNLARVRIYWQSQYEHNERRDPLHTIVLYGGNANTRGLTEHLARRLGIPCRIADLSRPLVDGSERVPLLHKSDALRYATVIGLALRSEGQS